MRPHRATKTIFGISASFLIVLGGCAGPMRVDKATRKSFVVPDICNADMRDQNNAQDCARELLPVGRNYGGTALAKLEAAWNMIPQDRLRQTIETKETIADKCVESAQPTMDLYDSGERYDAAEMGVGALTKCFFYAGLVLENFGAGDEGAALTEAANRSLWGLYIDDAFLIPPPDLDLGPREKTEKASAEPFLKQLWTDLSAGFFGFLR